MLKCFLSVMLVSIVIVGTTAQCTVDPMFQDIIEILKDGKSHLDIEITQVNQESENSGNHFTSWGKAIVSSLDNCELVFECHVKFSDRNFFKGDNDLVKYRIDLKRSKLTTKLMAWGGAELVTNNLERDGNMIYKKTESGMILLNVKFIKN